MESDDLAGDVNYSFSFEKKKFLNSGARANTQALALEAFNYMEAQNVWMHTVDVKAKMDPIEIPIILTDVYFALAKWDLNDQARAALDTVVKTLTLNPNIVIELRSHTDYRDVDDKNQILSQHRADTSVSYLISRGIHPDRLVAVGMGESQPFEIPAGYKGLGADLFPAGTQLDRTQHQEDACVAARGGQPNQPPCRTSASFAMTMFPLWILLPWLKLRLKRRRRTTKPVIGQMYTVQERDTYTTICRNNNITISDLKRLNGGLRGVRPFPGMVLKVTVRGDYTEFDKTHRQVAVDESFRSIAKELGMRPKGFGGDEPRVRRRASSRYLHPHPVKAASYLCGMEQSARYAGRGVSSGKEEVHKAIKHIDKGLFPKAFCKIVPDDLTGSEEHCLVMHADGAGTKSLWPTSIGRKRATSPFGRALHRMRSS